MYGTNLKMSRNLFVNLHLNQQGDDVKSLGWQTIEFTGNSIWNQDNVL